jgi:hypothetical protein
VAVFQPLQEVLGVHHGDDGIELGAPAHVIVDEEGLRHGCGVGKAGSFDQDGVEAALAFHQVADDAYEIAAHSAADAAVVHLEHFFLGIDHEFVVDAELAEFVDDDGVVLAVLLGKYAIEQRRLTGAEIASQHRNGHLVHDLLLWL